MKIENLKVGQVLKNYKVLCEALGIEVKSGNTKKAQMKDLERYLTYTKDKNSFVITEIFETPKPKEENKRNSIYAENLDKLIINMCSKTENSIYHYSEFSTNGILVELSMINRNFSIGRNNMNKFSRYLEIPIEVLHDFYNTTYKKNKDIIEGGLNRLKSQCLIDWYYVTKVKPLKDNYRNATDYELEGIKEIEQEVLLKLELKSKQEVFLKGRWNEFSKEVSKGLREHMGLLFSFQSYHIVSTKLFRKMLLEEREKQSIEWDLNVCVQESSINSAEKRHAKSVEEYRPYTLLGKAKTPEYDRDKCRLSEEYVDYNKRIVRICVDTLHPVNLYELIKDIEDEKYTYKESQLTDYQKECIELNEDLEEFFG